MRTIAYKTLPGVGPGEFPKEAVLRDFVLDLPYLLSFNLIPPISILNDLFDKGILDAGMSGGCRWHPFTIDRHEHDELVQALLDLPDSDYRCVEVPEWVRNQADWHVWTMEYEMGIPAQKHSELSQVIDKWANLEKEAIENGDHELAAEYRMHIFNASEKLVEFTEPYIEKYHSEKSRS